MNRWRAEYDDGIWRFYRDGMELPFSVKGDIVVDALNDADSRIAELSQAVGLITTLKPTMVMDTEHPLDMAKEVVEYMTTIIANTQQANRGLGANYIYELNENIKLTARIAKLEAERRWIPVSERLPDIEDGDNKDYDVVLTYPFRRDVIVATWSYDALDKTHRRRWFDCSSDEWGPDDITEYVTHWRERPTPPEVQE